MLLKGVQICFAWIYKDMKGIPLELAQHRIELNTSIPPAHQTRYILNPVIFKQDINKLLVAKFIQLVEKATWL
jgi:hypothetical protein